jgi:RNA-binding protein
MRGRDRAELRSEAHHLKATVHVGQQGVTESLGRSVDEALSARELVKLQLGRNAPMAVREAAGELAGAHGAEVIQVIGRTFTLYRHNPALERAADGTPPWRR